MEQYRNIIFRITAQNHDIIKFIANANDESMRDLILRGLENEIKKITKVRLNLRNNKKITDTQINKIMKLLQKKY